MRIESLNKRKAEKAGGVKIHLDVKGKTTVDNT